MFEELAKANVAPEIKFGPTALIKKNGKHEVFWGTISKVEVSYGFVKRDGIGDSIYVYRFDNDKVDWEQLRRNDKVSFKVGFNYRGPIALELTLL